MKRPCSALLTIALSFGLTLPSTSIAANAPRTASIVLQKVTSDATSGITEYKLPSNGLQVLLAERHHTPLVTVMVVYHVGSRNEAVGYTGSTHFLEHMMFKGTPKFDPLKGTGIDDVLKPMGGINNATTYYDRTNYFETMPSQYLAKGLEIEADRMRHALLRESDREKEMTVVRNELERNEDDAGRLLEWNVFAQAFLAHPYHHPVIGWRSDVEGVPIERLRKFYNDFYYPNNATLVVIGDFKTPEALQLISKHFGAIPSAPQPFPKVYTQEPPQIGERRFVVRRGEDLPKVEIGWHISNAVNKDNYALDVMGAILGDERRQSSRLYKSLVDPGLASECFAYGLSMRDPGLFMAGATATPGSANEKLESVLRDQLQKLATEPISDEELDKAKKSIWKRWKLEAADPMGMSSQLAEAIAVADWQWWVNYDKNIKAVTKADIARVAKKYFSNQNSTVGYYYPAKEPEPQAPKNAEPANNSESEPPKNPESEPPKGSEPEGPTAPPAPPSPPSPPPAQQQQRASVAAQVKKKVLPNGMTVLVLPVKGTGVVAVAAKIRAGEYFHPKDLYSVPDFVAEMLDKGSAHWSKEALAKQLEMMGTSLNFNAANFWLSFNSDIVQEDLPQFLSMASDVLQNPLFPADELAKSRKQANARIQADMADTGQVASNELFGALYKPDCVFYEPPFKDQLAELDKLNVDQLRAFHKAHVTPANTVLAVVGDIDPDTAFELVSKNFSQWSGAPADKITMEMCTANSVAGKKIEKNMPDKTNVDVLMGSSAPLSIHSKDFYAASIANSALGHDTLSSRLADLRIKHGLTYGVGSYFTENAYENGAWIVTYSTNPQNLNKSFPIVDTIIQNYIKNGITKKELAEEAKRLGGEYVVERMRTPRQLADAITKYEFLGLGTKFMDEYPLRLSKVTAPEVNAAIKKYFDPKKLVITVAGTLPK